MSDIKGAESTRSLRPKRRTLGQRLKTEWPLHLMLLPNIILLAIFAYLPMVGIVIAFQNFNPRLGFFGSEFIGLNNFRYLMKLPTTRRILFNTIFISAMKIILGLVVPVIFAVLLDLIRSNAYKRTIQTIIYFPYFLSWVIFSGILADVLSPSTGIVNRLIEAMGFEPVHFLSNDTLFPHVLIVTDVLKNFGYGTIIYLAAITSIDVELYEAAVMDGANRWHQTRYITLPGLLPMVIVMGTLSLGNVLNAGFDQILNLYSPAVYSTGDVIDTFIYRLGLVSNQFGIASAAGLFKSLVSLIFISVGYWLAYRFANFRVF